MLTDASFGCSCISHVLYCSVTKTGRTFFVVWNLALLRGECVKPADLVCIITWTRLISFDFVFLYYIIYFKLYDQVQKDLQRTCFMIWDHHWPYTDQLNWSLWHQERSGVTDTGFTGAAACVCVCVCSAICEAKWNWYPLLNFKSSCFLLAFLFFLTNYKSASLG